MMERLPDPSPDSGEQRIQNRALAACVVVLTLGAVLALLVWIPGAMLLDVPRIATAFVSLAILGVSLLACRYVRLIAAGRAEWRRLAQFPDRNPNPVFRLSPLGEVQYTNSGARAMATCLGGDGDVARILPPNLAGLLTELQSARTPARTVEYDCGPWRLEARLHYLRDLDCVHAYVTDVTELRAAQERLIHEAYHDPLTGLPNRRRYDEAIGDVLHGRGRRGMRGALFAIGLDRLKNVEDSLGHAARDAVLREVASRLLRLVRDHDGTTVDAEAYRFDGGLFAVLIPGYAEGDMPIRFAERLREALREPYYAEGREIVVTASIGIAVYPLDAQDGAVLLKNGDAAMQRVREAGGDGVQCYTHDMNVQAAEIFSLENHLRHALELNEFELWYQPQLEIRTNRLVGVEALLRWRHPDRGMILPSRFIPLAEETSQILAIGEWTLRAAVAELRRWHDAGLRDLVVAVNVSGRQLQQRHFPQLVADVLRDSGVLPGQLEIEITESVAMHDVDQTIAMLNQLKQLGVRLAVDDFGTGFSSLSYLTRFPIDRLKVDQSFARHVTDHIEDAAVARAVTELGHSLGLIVIAEGVETAAQLAFFERTHCDEYQGYFAGMPMPSHDIPRRYRGDAAMAAM
jgi:diguanylate cyclase (GGDEF)-like protein